jgi:hypothetical protein
MSRQPHDRLRALNQPKPIHGRVDHRGRPVALEIGGRLRHVEQIVDRWRIDDEWWRKEICRMYWQVVLEDGQPLVVVQDMITGGWYRQTASEPATIKDACPMPPPTTAAATPQPPAAEPLHPRREPGRKPR